VADNWSTPAFPLPFVTFPTVRHCLPSLEKKSFYPPGRRLITGLEDSSRAGSTLPQTPDEPAHGKHR